MGVSGNTSPRLFFTTNVSFPCGKEKESLSSALSFCPRASTTQTGGDRLTLPYRFTCFTTGKRSLGLKPIAIHVRSVKASVGNKGLLVLVPTAKCGHEILALSVLQDTLFIDLYIPQQHQCWLHPGRSVDLCHLRLDIVFRVQSSLLMCLAPSTSL